MSFSVEGTEVGIGASIGVACAPMHGHEADDLVHAADMAMYHATRNATGVAVYAPSTDVRRPERLILRQELRHAIGAGQLEVHYQPQVAPDGRLVGAEALVRWAHPERGLLMPNDFLRLAEESDLICELTDAVLAIALRDASRWSIQTAGVRVSLDDFGTGFAPLATLREIPVDELKIDRSFVQGIDDAERDAAVVGGLIRLEHDLGLTVVAEGVETRRGAAHLDTLDCDVLQGVSDRSPASRRGSRTGGVGSPLVSCAARTHGMQPGSVMRRPARDN